MTRCNEENSNSELKQLQEKRSIVPMTVRRQLAQQLIISAQVFRAQLQ